MRKVVKRYEIPTSQLPNFELELHAGSELLNLQMVRGVPCLWAMVDLDAKVEKVRFTVRGDGHDCRAIEEDHYNYFGTFQLEGGKYVLHLFVGNEL